MARQGLTTEQRQKQREARRAVLADRARRTRFFISLSLTGSWLGGYRYKRYAWPKLFTAREEAEAFAEANNPFKNRAATAERGRIKSYCIETTVLRET